MPPPRSSRMEGRATFTTTASTVTTKNPTTAAASVAVACGDRRVLRPAGAADAGRVMLCGSYRDAIGAPLSRGDVSKSPGFDRRREARLRGALAGPPYDG